MGRSPARTAIFFPVTEAGTDIGTPTDLARCRRSRTPRIGVDTASRSGPYSRRVSGTTTRVTSSNPNSAKVVAEGSAFERAFGRAVLEPDVPFIPVGDSQRGGRIDPVPTPRVPDACAPPRQTSRAEIVCEACSESFFVRVVERHLLHVRVVLLAAKRREDRRLVTGDRTGNKEGPSGIGNLHLGGRLEVWKGTPVNRSAPTLR